MKIQNITKLKVFWKYMTALLLGLSFCVCGEDGVELRITFSENGSATGTIVFPQRLGESLYTRLEVRENSAKRAGIGEIRHLYGSLRDPKTRSNPEIVVGVLADKAHEVSMILDTKKTMTNNGEVLYLLDLRLPQKEDIAIGGLLNGFVPVTSLRLEKSNKDENFEVSLDVQGHKGIKNGVTYKTITPSHDNALLISIRPIKYSIETLWKRAVSVSVLVTVAWSLCYFLLKGTEGGKVSLPILRVTFGFLSAIFLFLSISRYNKLGELAFFEFSGMLFLSGFLLFAFAAIAGKKFIMITEPFIQCMNYAKNSAFGTSDKGPANAE